MFNSAKKCLSLAIGLTCETVLFCREKIDNINDDQEGYSMPRKKRSVTERLSIITPEQIIRIETSYRITRETLAWMLKVSPSTVRAWELGTRLPTPVYAEVLKKMLRCYMNEFTRNKAEKVIETASSYCNQWGDDQLSYLMENLYKIEEI